MSNMSQDTNKALLVILDGWGIGTLPESDAIRQADTPTMDALMNRDMHGTLITHGSAVGLPEGQMGNSEVGHMHIGAGRVIYQDLLKISNAITDGTLADQPELRRMIANIDTGRLHLIGLVSDGGVHSHIDHLFGVMRAVRSRRRDVKIYLHLFTDGRDTAPDGGKNYIARVLDVAEELGGVYISTIVGRYYAMDRDQRWERTKRAYDLLVKGIGRSEIDAISAIQTQYEAGITDEFLEPMVLHQEGLINDGDTALFFNFRSDRPRQLTSMLVEHEEPTVGSVPLQLNFYTMTSYDEQFEHVRVIFDKEWPTDTLGEWLASHGKRQLRVAETEKYPHVTYFFSGGHEEAYDDEERALIHSPKVATYDLQPTMSAAGVTDAVVQALCSSRFDFICVNYANADMVGHTGVFEAAVEACTYVDSCVSQLLAAARDQGYHVVIIADHGNADFMINEDGSPHTAHTTNLVPVIYIDDQGMQQEVNDGSLIDVAPTILHCLGLTPPSVMEGRNLLS